MLLHINGKATNVDPRDHMRLTRNERLVLDVAMEVIGGIENAIMDGVWEDEYPSFDDLVEMAMQDVFAETPREARFIGTEKAQDLCMLAACEFDPR